MEQKKKRVLIVEDEEALLFALKKLLQNKDTEIDVACSLKEASKFLENNSYMAVITDLRLSNSVIIEGYEVAKIAKKLQPKCTIIIVTAFAKNKIEFQATDGAVDYYLEKPVSPIELKEIISNL